MTGKQEAPCPMLDTLYGIRPSSRAAALRTLALVGVLLFGSGCQNIFHGLFAPRTTPEDQDLTSFAEYRQRAATYYDAGDFVRARVQYEKALELRPNHQATRLGYAYSLLYTNTPSALISARTEFESMQRVKKGLKVKRDYGLAMTYRNLAAAYERRSRNRGREGLLNESKRDMAVSRDYARDGKTLFKTVIKEEGRKWSSLKPDAYVGMAHVDIMLGEFDEAIEYIEKFAAIATEARQFWERDREMRLAANPLRDNNPTLTDRMRVRYTERILRTTTEEAGIRKILLGTLLYLNRYDEAIAQCNVIMALTPEDDELLLLRGRAYAILGDYAKGLKDIEAYRDTLDQTRQTDHSVSVSQLIVAYRDRLEEQRKAQARDG